MATNLYRPYGEQVETVISLAIKETKGFIGERYDTDAGFSSLNTRYYDPRLGLFLQPDWWEVLQPGVGTNRYAYSFNDPVNGKDQTGHAAQHGPTDQSPNRSVWGERREDGSLGFSGFINKGDPGYGDNFTDSGVQPSDWVHLGDALRGLEDKSRDTVEEKISLKNVQLVGFIFFHHSLPDYLESIGYGQINGIGLTQEAMAKMMGLHGAFSVGPATKSKFASYLNNKKAMRAFVERLIDGSIVTPNGYKTKYARPNQVGVAISTFGIVGLTGQYRGNAPFATNSVRLDMRVVGPGLVDIVNGYPAVP